jgi:tRNA pseudouridine38-40 synthase
MVIAEMRIALGVEYDGTAYVGWQRQKSGVGVQECLEEAVGRVADDPVEAVCAGRTDAGVHAAGQVVHFDTGADRSARGWLLGINSNLPDDVNVTWARTVNDDFHARYSALSRSYRYLVLNRLARSALFRRRAWWVHEPLDEKAMAAGGALLVGEHDFSAFRATGCQSRTPVRELRELTVTRRGHWIAIDITANAFVQHMVRNIAGTLVSIGRGDQAPDWAAQVLAGRDRAAGGATAPPHGLTLMRVRYPAALGIPPADGDAGAFNVYDAPL